MIQVEQRKAEAHGKNRNTNLSSLGLGAISQSFCPVKGLPLLHAVRLEITKLISSKERLRAPKLEIDFAKRKRLAK